MDADVSACKHFRSGELPKCRASGTTRKGKTLDAPGRSAARCPII
jgi:hypothetical protein